MTVTLYSASWCLNLFISFILVATLKLTQIQSVLCGKGDGFTLSHFFFHCTLKTQLYNLLKNMFILAFHPVPAVVSRQPGQSLSVQLCVSVLRLLLFLTRIITWMSYPVSLTF